MSPIRVALIWGIALFLAVAPQVSGAAITGLPDFTSLVEKHGSEVVNISTTQKVKVPAPPPQLPQGKELPDNIPWEEFFKKFFGEDGQPRETSSLGSGFIISTDGYIITNHHVVKDADEIVVRLQDRREFEAKIIGSDKRSDIALLKIDAKDLPAAKIGSSDKLRAGEWVLAIGSPFGFEASVTAGIVSAKGRSLPSDNYVSFIQTDVAINPGNSGGPLFNLDGDVIGVNSQIYSRTGGFMGLSFSIPIETAMHVVEQLKKSGKVTRGWLGVQIQDVTRELAQSFGMDGPHGALVSRVLPGSPAQAAGLQVGDIIVEFDGNKIDTSSSLPPLVGQTPIEKSVHIAIIRQGTKKMLPIKIGVLSDEEVADAAGSQVAPKSDNALNIIVSDPTEQQRQELDLPAHGVIVQNTFPGPASRAGISAGDVILQIQDKTVKDKSDFERIVKELPKDRPIAVLIQRRGGAVFVALRLDSKE